MLRLFISKEIFQNITNRAFWILGGVILASTILCTIIQIESFNNNKKAFDEYWIQHQKFYELRPNDLESLPFNMAVLPPSHLGMLFNGLKSFVSNRAIDQNSIEYLFKNLDLGILTGILFSLLAIILSFQTISGEREDGMLKLIDTYPVKRATIILGKWLGIVLIIGILYSFCYIIMTLLILVFANSQITSVDRASLCLIYLIGFLYISGIVLLGIYISIKVRQSYLSLLIALLVWAFTVLVLPSIPDYSGSLLIKSASPLRVLNDENECNNNKFKAIQKVQEKYRNEGVPEDKIEIEAKRDIELITKKFDEQRRQLNANFENGLIKRMAVSTGISLFSPYVCYTLSVNEIAATGISANISLIKQRENHSMIIASHLKKISDRLKIDPQYKPNFSDIPKFQFIYPSLKLRLIAVSVPLLLLLIFNILLFVFSFKSFLRYDIR
jgi:ABC-type transport system involved in multi-copper enzyme maturation permease subunit